MIGKCPRCGKERRIYAKGLCMSCYDSNRKGCRVRKYVEWEAK